MDPIISTITHCHELIASSEQAYRIDHLETACSKLSELLNFLLNELVGPTLNSSCTPSSSDSVIQGDDHMCLEDRRCWLIDMDEAYMFFSRNEFCSSLACLDHARLVLHNSIFGSSLTQPNILLPSDYRKEVKKMLTSQEITDFKDSCARAIKTLEAGEFDRCADALDVARSVIDGELEDEYDTAAKKENSESSNSGSVPGSSGPPVKWPQPSNIVEHPDPAHDPRGN